MKRENGVWLIYVGLILMIGLLTPNLVQPKEPGESKFSGQRAQLITDLGLSPDKAKDFLAVGGKWDHLRKDIVGKIKRKDSSYI